MPRLIENHIQFPYKRSLGPVFGAFMTALVGRKILGIRKGDLLDIHVEEGRLVLLKIEPECVICGAADNLRTLHDKHVCTGCASELSLVDA